jgi:hypothetical protein
MRQIPSEWCRRDLVHAKAYGILSNAQVMRYRFTRMKHPPKWVFPLLDGILARGRVVAAELSRHRGEVKI